MMYVRDEYGNFCYRYPTRMFYHLQKVWMISFYAILLLEKISNRFKSSIESYWGSDTYGGYCIKISKSQK